VRLQSASGARTPPGPGAENRRLEALARADDLTLSANVARPPFPPPRSDAGVANPGCVARVERQVALLVEASISPVNAAAGRTPDSRWVADVGDDRLDGQRAAVVGLRGA